MNSMSLRIFNDEDERDDPCRCLTLLLGMEQHLNRPLFFCFMEGGLLDAYGVGF